MKNIINKLMLPALCWLLPGCSSEMTDYSGSDGLYFAVQYPWSSGYGDSTVWEYNARSVFSFSETIKTDTLIRLKVKLQGHPVGYDRYFYIRLDESTTAESGREFEIENRYVLPANSIVSYVDVVLYKTSLLEDTTRQIGICLAERGDFKRALDQWHPLGSQHGSAIDAYKHTIEFSDRILDPGNAWDIAYWGVYSERKIRLISEICNVSISEFTTMNKAKMLSVAGIFQLFLDENPQPDPLEPDGIMKMGSYV